RADVFVHPSGVLDRQGALLLEDDVVVLPALDRLERNACVPVRAERRTTGADQAVLQPPAPRRRQLPHQAGQVVARGEAVADEQGLQRGALIPTGHANLPWARALPKRRAREPFGRRSLAPAPAALTAD